MNITSKLHLTIKGLIKQNVGKVGLGIDRVRVYYLLNLIYYGSEVQMIKGCTNLWGNVHVIYLPCQQAVHRYYLNICMSIVIRAPW